MNRLWRREERKSGMVLKEKGTRFCRGGKVFTVGGRVLGNEACDYAGLHGVITGIYTGADGVVGLDAPEICCDFERPVSEEMIRDLEDRFSDICGEPTTIDDILFDNVIVPSYLLEPSAELPAEVIDLSGKMEAAADIFAKVLQMPDEDLSALYAFPCAPADDEATSWEVTTQVCCLGGCEMSVYSFPDERSARLFAVLLERSGCRLRYAAACPDCYAEYQKDRL